MKKIALYLALLGLLFNSSYAMDLADPAEEQKFIVKKKVPVDLVSSMN